MWNLVQSRRQGKAVRRGPHRKESHPRGRSFCEGNRTPVPSHSSLKEIHAMFTATLLVPGTPERDAWKDLDQTVSRTGGRMAEWGWGEETQWDMQGN